MNSFPSVPSVFVILLATLAIGHAKPNIVLVMADDHGYGDCGYTGHPFVKTPHLDAMAAEGVVFDRFYAAAPVCSPTRASVMTGRHPFRGNVPNHGHYLRPHEITIAEALKSAGYVTSSYFSPTLDRPIALALVRGGGSRLGERVGVYHLGAEQSATIVPACQFDPDGERLHA